MATLDTTQRYRLLDRLLLEEAGDQVLAFDPETLSVHQFNTSLAHLARLADGSSSCEQLTAEFADHYGLEIRDASQQVYQGLLLLKEKGLLEVR